MTVGYLYTALLNAETAGKQQLLEEHNCFFRAASFRGHFYSKQTFSFSLVSLKPHGGPDLRESAAHPDIFIIAFQGQLAAAGKRGVYLFEYKPQLAPLRVRTLGGGGEGVNSRCYLPLQPTFHIQMSPVSEPLVLHSNLQHQRV